MRFEDQGCKCECSKIVAEMYGGRLSTMNKLTSRLDSLLSPELRFSTSQSVIKSHEDSRKQSLRKCSIADDQPRVSRRMTMFRADSDRRTSSRTRSSRSSVRASSSAERRKSSYFPDTNNKKLSQETRELKHKKRKRALSRKQVIKYCKGLYPGIVVGHVNCVDSPVIVPKNMGWLWNVTDEVTGRKPHPEWIPGAIPKYLKSMIKRIRLELDGERIENPLEPAPSKKPAKYRTTQDGQKGSQEEFAAQPTLHLHTKKGVYCIKVLPDQDDDYRKEPMMFTLGQDDNERVSSSDSSLEIELIRPVMNVKYDKNQESPQECVVEQELTAEIQKSKSIVTKKKKYVSKKSTVKL